MFSTYTFINFISPNSSLEVVGFLSRVPGRGRVGGSAKKGRDVQKKAHVAVQVCQKGWGCPSFGRREEGGGGVRKGEEK